VSEREQLEKALDVVLVAPHADQQHHARTVHAAARERLAQLPEKCGTCEGSRLSFRPTAFSGFADCEDCGGRGTVYPKALVEVVAHIFHQNGEWMRWAEAERWAVAVLDALNDWKPK